MIKINGGVYINYSFPPVRSPTTCSFSPLLLYYHRNSLWDIGWMPYFLKEKDSILGPERKEIVEIGLFLY